jgi:hypothetical protein
VQQAVFAPVACALGYPLPQCGANFRRQAAAVGEPGLSP